MSNESGSVPRSDQGGLPPEPVHTDICMADKSGKCVCDYMEQEHFYLLKIRAAALSLQAENMSLREALKLLVGLKDIKILIERGESNGTQEHYYNLHKEHGWLKARAALASGRG